MSYLNRLKAEAEKRQGDVPAKGVKAPSAPFAGTGAGHYADLPPELAAGLARLSSMPAPRLTLPQAWPQIVSDALRLVTGGWAAEALAAGMGSA